MEPDNLDFDIWVELDHEESRVHQDSQEEFCNVSIQFNDGRKISLIVWSERCFCDAVEKLDWLEPGVGILPDLVVRDFTSPSIRNSIERLVSNHNWLAGRGLPIVEVWPG